MFRTGQPQLMPAISRAFADALTAELPGLRRFATALCGNPALADDLVQDCIEAALMNADTIRELNRLGAWLRTTVRNRFIDEVRRRNTRGTGVDVQDLADDIALSVPAASGELRDVLEAAARLTPDHRDILVLAGVEALSYRDIALELTIPVGTVMSRLARARAALRALLDPADQPA
jgi:RNA polymerase sigma-70 factor (ECF subfamily)